jgi:hypothetical protein
VIMHRVVELPLVNAGKSVIARYGATRVPVKADAV